MRAVFYKVISIGSGFLAVMAKPTAGEWLDDEMGSLAASGIQRVVSLLEISEAYEVGLKEEQQFCEKHGMEFASYPIPDRGLPKSVSEFAQFTKDQHTAVNSGRNTVIHCRAGIGRTGIVAASVLLHVGLEASEAFSCVSEARGVNVPDTEEQIQWLEKNASEITMATHN